MVYCSCKFLSTLSLRRATVCKKNIGRLLAISIHALLAESDRLWTILYSCPGNFYPRSPCGERRGAPSSSSGKIIFLSTLSLRRATNDAINGCNPDFISIHALLAESDKITITVDEGTLISIHALLAESDDVSLIYTNRCRDFYPRSPCGERPALRQALPAKLYFYPRSPCGERLPLSSSPRLAVTAISIHALLAESDQGIRECFSAV